VRGRIGERTDHFEHLDHRAGPAVSHDQWQRVLVIRLDVDEMDVDTVDLGRELTVGSLHVWPGPRRRRCP
jgi:hypothetical protein